MAALRASYSPPCFGASNTCAPQTQSTTAVTHVQVIPTTYHVHHPVLLPSLGRIGLANAHSGVELLATTPKLSIQLHLWQALAEPIGSAVGVSIAREKLPSGPIGAHSIELLGNPPALWVHSIV
jgi:hypothetical protein